MLQLLKRTQLLQHLLIYNSKRMTLQTVQVHRFSKQAICMHNNKRMFLMFLDKYLQLTKTLTAHLIQTNKLQTHLVNMFEEN